MLGQQAMTDATNPVEHVDPVCGMTVDPADAAGSVAYRGQTYYFCNPSCIERFRAAPEDFVGDKAQRPSLAPDSNGEYTCPMHPEIVRDAPGACPICGMALEPRTISLTDEPNPELVDMTRRFWIGTLLGAPVFLITMADMAGGGLTTRLGPIVNWMGLALATPVVFWAGWPFFDRAWASIVNRSPNMFTLIAMGVGSAYLYSALGTIAPGMFPEGFRMQGVVQTYFDTAVVITVLVLLGQVLELRARSQTSSAIKQLLGLAPKTARVVRRADHIDSRPDLMRSGAAYFCHSQAVLKKARRGTLCLLDRSLNAQAIANFWRRDCTGRDA